LLTVIKETLYNMTCSFHHNGADQEVNEDFDSLRGGLDKLKRMEANEWGIGEEDIEERDSASSVPAPSSTEEEAMPHALE
jgi:hypothetical protein